MNKEISILEKIKQQMSLSNRYFYWSLFIVLIGILTWINNYGFYSHVERTSVRMVVQFEKNILELIDNYPNQNKEEIQQLIIKLASRWQQFSYYNNGIELILLNNERKILQDTKKWDNSTSSKFSIDIKRLINKEEGGVVVESLTSKKQVFNSIISSMTFSIVDMYNDLFSPKKSPFNGKVYIKNRDKVNDGIIVINNNNSTDVEKKYLLIIGENNNIEEIDLSPYEEIKIKNGSAVLKGQQLSKGSIHTLIYKTENLYWLRSRTTIGFAIFTYLILWLSRKRTYKLEELEYKEDDKLIIEIRNGLNNNITNTSIKDKIERYDSILNPPIDTLKFENLFDDLDTIGTKFRKVAEKIIFRVYEEQIGALPYRLSLSSAIYELNQRRILSDSAKNYISIVRVYGNISSHYSDNVISREEAIAIASSLLNVIDEIYEKNLLR